MNFYRRKGSLKFVTNFNNMSGTWIDYMKKPEQNSVIRPTDETTILWPLAAAEER